MPQSITHTTDAHESSCPADRYLRDLRDHAAERLVQRDATRARRAVGGMRQRMLPVRQSRRAL
jgi:hypothetical protein